MGFAGGQRLAQEARGKGLYSLHRQREGHSSAHMTAAYLRLPVCVVQILPIARHRERILEPFENPASARLSWVQAFCSMGACVQQTQVGHCSCKKWALCVRK